MRTCSKPVDFLLKVVNGGWGGEMVKKMVKSKVWDGGLWSWLVKSVVGWWWRAEIVVHRDGIHKSRESSSSLCWNHHKAIRHIDTVRAYTFGSHYFVEVDIVLPSDMPLQTARDIGESLQEKLELLPEIERAFVHLDFEYSHKTEHAQTHH
ncbi:hypothetical protein R6Q57_001789 [Mikania cordata]